MSRLETLLVSLLIACVCSAADLQAQAPMRSDPQKLLAFAHHLREKGDLYRAEGEYMAFLILFPQHPRAAEAWFFLGRTRQSQNNAEGALEAFVQAARTRDPFWSGEAAVGLGETLLNSGKPVEAARSLEAVARDPAWGGYSSRALWLAAKAWLEARDWQRARAVLLEIRPGDPEAHEAALIAQRIEAEAPWLPRKDAWVAGGLSALLPGAGHLYAGRPWEALTSFLLNLAFLAGSVWSAKEGCLVSSGIISFLELSWYLGGIESAAEAARTYNRQQEERWLRELGQMPISVTDPSFSGQGKLSLGGLHWRF